MKNRIIEVMLARVIKRKEDIFGSAKKVTVILNLIYLFKVKINRFRLCISWINALNPLNSKWSCQS